ncbi:MAG: preprotein translocase subunit YajC [Planctomycetaceae bacterium]|nr:preprotein translocase subunit YajC [Planctomycetaceae bacterium]
MENVIPQLWRTCILAQDAVKPGEPNPLVTMGPFLIIGVMFYLLFMRPQQKEQQKRAAVLANLKKNDKVVTAGGIIGTVVEVSSDNARITLKVDDNTRIKFLRSSIQGLLEDSTDSNSST